MKKYLFLVAAAITALSSCAEYEDDGDTGYVGIKEFTVVLGDSIQEGSTRTTLQSATNLAGQTVYRVKLTNSDLFSVNGFVYKTTATNAGSYTITAVGPRVGFAATAYYAFYPATYNGEPMIAHDGTVTSNDGKVIISHDGTILGHDGAVISHDGAVISHDGNLQNDPTWNSTLKSYSLPSVYNYDGGYNMPMSAYATSTNPTLYFKNITGVLALTIPTDQFPTVKSITVESDKQLTGDFYAPLPLEYTLNFVPSNDVTTKNSVTLDCGNGVSNSGGRFYLPVTPGAHTYFKITVKGSNGTKTMSTRADATINVLRNHIYSITCNKLQ